MTAKAILKARPGTFRFSDRAIDLEVKFSFEKVISWYHQLREELKKFCKCKVKIHQVPCKIGRAFKNDKSESTNGFFDCKVRYSTNAMVLLLFCVQVNGQPLK